MSADEEQPAPRDPRTLTADEIAKALAPIIGGAEVGIARKDRHDPSSLLLLVTIEPHSPITFDALTQIAGLFETPNITIGATLSPTPGATCTGAAAAECPECAPEARALIKVRW